MAGGLVMAEGKYSTRDSGKDQRREWEHESNGLPVPVSLQGLCIAGIDGDARHCTN
jgi:hypothetical protein